MNGSHKDALTSLSARVAALGMVVMTLSSCVVTYRTLPESTTEAGTFPKTNLHLSYRPAEVEPWHNLPDTILPIWIGHYPLIPIWRCNEGTLVQELVGRGVVREAIVESAAPQKGIYYSATVTNEQVPGPLDRLVILLLDPVMILSYATLPVGPWLPYYSGHAGHLIRYDLYVDGEFKKTYRYEITKKGVAWVGLLPFAWVNFFTDDQQDACRAVLHRFIRDVERDGYLNEG